MLQDTEEDLGDVGPTEVQLPDPAPVGDAARLKHSTSGSQSSQAALDNQAAGGDEAESTAQEPTADADMHEESVPEAVRGTHEAEVAHKAVAVSDQMVHESPTQDLQLQLTYLEPDADVCHSETADKAELQQLDLQLTTEVQSPAAQLAADMHDDSRKAAGDSPAQQDLNLNLDTQLPADADKAVPAAAALAAHTSPQPPFMRGWWNQPWSIADHAEEAAPPAAGMTTLRTSDAFLTTFAMSCKCEFCLT